MKYFNFKRYKFSTVLKRISNIRYNFLSIFKLTDLKRFDFKKLYKYIDIGRLDFKKLYKYIDIGRFDLTKVTKYFNLRTYNISRIKKIKFVSNKVLFIHFPLLVIFFGLLYLVIPTFYNYDKLNIEKVVCQNKNIECTIRGKVSYSFYPTPRIKVRNLVIYDFLKEKNILIKIEHAIIKLSIKNLLAKEKHKFRKVELNNFEINFDLNNFKKYKSIFPKKIDLIPTSFTKGQIIFFDGKNYVATINNANINLKFKDDIMLAILKGEFLNDNIYINLDHKKVDNKSATNIILKMRNLNLITKANFFNFEKDKNTIKGNILIKKNKHKLTAIIDYKNNEIIVDKSNLTNPFLDGKLNGKIKFLPYFNFDLDINLNSINFTKLYVSFLELDKESKKKLFSVNNKINGKLNLSADKVYSKYNLVKSFESRIKFNNGSTLIDQFLINLGKLGAADILGSIKDDKKFTNFKFESNIFVDNQKKFLSKFGIYNKKSIPSSLFISGNFDLENPRTTFYEISDDKKLNNDELNYIEKEFNYLMLEDGYNSLFHFPKLKEFIKSVTNEAN